MTLALSVGIGFLLGAVPAAAVAAAPTIESESVSHLTPTGAVLEAEINPGGLETGYQFHLEYGCFGGIEEVCPFVCRVELGPECPMTIEIPLPSGDLPPSTEAENARLDLNEVGVTLQPGTKYRYRVEATNGAGTAIGPNHTFIAPTTSHPVIENESVSSLSPTDATLGARINPEGSEHGVLYQFQVASNASEFRPEFTCPTEGFPAGSSLCLLLESQPGALPLRVLAGGSGGKPVSLDLAQAGMELEPNTTYHYRVIAAESAPTIDTIDWAEPIVYGADQTFKTTASAPKVEDESAMNVTPTDATLEATIDPGGSATSYEFHLLEHRKCKESFPLCGPPSLQFPLPEGQLPASDETQRVSLDLNGVGVILAPNHDFYEYWVSAANSAGSIEAKPQTFTTPPFRLEGEGEVRKGEQAGGNPPPPPSSQGDGSPSAAPCRHSPRSHHRKRHGRHRLGIGKACGWA